MYSKSRVYVGLPCQAIINMLGRQPHTWVGIFYPVMFEFEPIRGLPTFLQPATEIIDFHLQFAVGTKKS